MPQRRLLIGQYEDVEAQREERAIDQERAPAALMAPGPRLIAEGFRHLDYNDDHALNAAEWIVYNALCLLREDSARRQTEPPFRRSCNTGPRAQPDNAVSSSGGTAQSGQ